MSALLGAAEFKSILSRSIGAQQVASRTALGKAAHLVERETKALLSETSHERGTPTPSLEGQPPSLASGNLRRSITVTGPATVGPAMWEARVGPTAVYGRIQELGGWTGHSSHLPPRPYLAPALEGSRAEIRNIFREAWRKALFK